LQILVGKLERDTRNRGVGGGIILKCIPKIVGRESMEWINLAPDKDQWWILQ
jgi:hypothetical protein